MDAAPWYRKAEYRECSYRITVIPTKKHEFPTVWRTLKPLKHIKVIILAEMKFFLRIIKIGSEKSFPLAVNCFSYLSDIFSVRIFVVAFKKKGQATFSLRWRQTGRRLAKEVRRKQRRNVVIFKDRAQGASSTHAAGILHTATFLTALGVSLDISKCCCCAPGKEKGQTTHSYATYQKKDNHPTSLPSQPWTGFLYPYLMTKNNFIRVVEYAKHYLRAGLLDYYVMYAPPITALSVENNKVVHKFFYKQTLCK